MDGLAEPERPDLRISALGAIYQADKADSLSNFNVAMAMMGIGAAYIIGALGISDKFGEGALTWNLVLFAALPLWLIVVFHSLLTLNAMTHGVSQQILEDELFVHTGLPGKSRIHIGSQAGDRIMDITKSRLAHKVATVVVYGGVALLICGFTVYVEVESFAHVRMWIAIASVLIYLALILIVLWSWAIGFGELKQANAVKGELATKLAKP